MRISVERIAVRGAPVPVEAGTLRTALRRELTVALAGRPPTGREQATRIVSEATAAAVRGGRR